MSSLHRKNLEYAYNFECDEAECDLEECSEMVKEVNETLLSTEDILSDHAYFYNAYLGDITY